MKIPQLKLSSSKLITLVAFYFTAVLNLAFYQKVLALNPLTGTSADWFIYTMPFVLFFILNAAFQIITSPFVHKVLIPLLLVISSAISYNSLFLNVYFDMDMLNNVLQTNAAESMRLLTSSYVLWILCLGVLPALLYLFIKVDYKKWHKELLMRFGLICLSALMVGAVAKGFYQDYASFFRNHRDVVHLLTPSNFIGATIKKVKRIHRDNIPYTQQDLNAKQAKPNTLRNFTVLIVGETTRGQNWGLNGYARQTTPLLAKRGDQIFNFSNVSSCGTATAISVPCMFSTMNRTEFDAVRADKQDNLLDILQRAGIAVKWFDNDSGCKGVCDRVPNVDVTALDLPEFCHNGECLDNILLPQLEKMLTEESSKDTVVVLHTIGSHGPTYNERYSAEYRQFTPTCDTNEINKCSNEQLVNTYDNGILYIDQFIDKVISQLEKRRDLMASVVYVSDHGESLGENGVYLHAAPYAIAPRTQTHVPMVMWFSEAFRQHKGIDFNCLAQNAKQKAYSHDNYFSTIFAMMDMSPVSETYRKSQDILAECRKAN